MKLNDWVFKIQDKKAESLGFAGYLIWVLLFAGLCNALICNEKPLFLRTDKGISSPAFVDFFYDLTLQKRPYFKAEEGWALYTLIPYSYNSLDKNNMTAIGPFGAQQVKSRRYRHWLGTDILGRDVLAGVMRSLYNALKIALLATVLSLVIGSVLGLFAGVAGDKKVKVNLTQVFLGIPLLFLSIFYFTSLFDQPTTRDQYAFGFCFLSLLLVLKYFGSLGNKIVSVPIDSMITTIIEIRKSVPGLIWVLVFISIFRYPGSITIILVISLIGWTSFARVARAEAIGLSSSGFVSYAEATGVGIFRLMYKHIYPNIKPILYTMAIFAFTSNILLESSLSFLGLGLPAEEISFGSLLSASKSNLRAWWLVAFPGLTLFMLILCLRILSGKTSENY